MERSKNEAEAYANDVIPRARGEAAKIMQAAEAYKQRVVAASEGEASRFVSIYNEYNKKNIYNSNLQRPLSKEPIVTAAINLLKLNNSHQTNSKNFFESLIFNNWIDADGYNDREQLANYINDKKIPKITINQIIKLIKNDVKVKHLNLNSLESTLTLIKKNQTLWGKRKTLAEWVSLTELYWKEIKIFEI